MKLVDLISGTSMNNLNSLRDYQIVNDPSIGHKIKRIAAQRDFQRVNASMFASLTPREIEVIKLLVRDHNNAQIANLLFISRHTVEQHRKNIRVKLRINTMPQLFQFALAFDLV